MKRYIVTGPLKVAGHATGETFSAAYTEEQERALIAGGHIQPAPSSSAKKEVASKEG